MINLCNDNYSLNIVAKSGEINSIKYNEIEFICADSHMAMFEICFRDNLGDVVKISTYDANNFLVARIDESKYCIKYFEFKNIDIVVEVNLEMGKVLNWKINVVNNTELNIEWISFPQIVIPNDLKGKGGNGEILWPYLEGVLIDDIEKRSKSMFCYCETDYPNCGSEGVFPAMVESQFIAYLSGDSGLYIGAHDSKCNLKVIDFNSCGDGIHIIFRVYPGMNPGESYYMDYDLVVCGFEGSWHNAADIYRNWFKTAKSNEFLEIENNKDLPEWYGESPIVITYPVCGGNDTDEMHESKLFPYENAMPHIKRLAEKLESKIMVILMQWESTAPWAPPYVYPPYGGVEMFNKFIDEIHRTGNVAGVYCSGIGWTQQSNLRAEYNKEEQFEKEELHKVMCMSPKGELLFSKICTPQRIGYDMCPTQDFTIQVTVKEISKIIDSGVDYIQALDQNHGGAAYFCYSKNHGHPPVPGKWQWEAMKDLLSQLRKVSKEKNKKVIFGCESAAAETVIPYLQFNDNRYNFNFAMGRAVPIYSYIYHKYINNFMGNQIGSNVIFDNIKSPENFLYRLTYSFCAGDMLTLVINDDGNISFNWGDDNIILPNQDDVLILVRNLNKWRRGIGRKYLYFGEMVSPFKLKDNMYNEFQMADGSRQQFEKILTSCWKASDNSIGQIFANYNKADIKFQIETEKDIYVYTDNDKSEKYGNDGSIVVKALSAVLVVMGD